MLEISELCKHFKDGGGKSSDRVMAVDGVSFTVESGQFFTLLGPSGCGKTTTLRCVAGLESPDSGSIVVDGRTLYSSADRTNVKANQRGLGMVFQSYAIWPHMTVAQNVSFPLTVGDRKARVSRAAVAKHTERVLDVVQLEHLAGRPATDLSGGQQQRLALARALVHQPPLLLLDEPLSNLDAKLREQMRFELKRLQRELGLTTVYVTHDQTEALAMSNVIAVMRAGRIEQVGSPREIYTRPATEFVADFIGISNFLRGEVGADLGGGEYALTTGDARIRIASERHLSVGSPAVAVARPECIDLTIAGESQDPADRLRGTVTTSVYLGEAVEALVDVGSSVLRVRTNATTPLAAGTDVLLGFASSLPRAVHGAGTDLTQAVAVGAVENAVDNAVKEDVAVTAGGR